MKKFIIHYLKGTISIVEVECELITGMQDPSIMWLPFGEYCARILSPKMLLEKNNMGEEVGPIYYGHAFYNSEQDCRVKIDHDVRDFFKRSLIKDKTKTYTEEDIQAKLLTIQTIKL